MGTLGINDLRLRGTRWRLCLGQSKKNASSTLNQGWTRSAPAGCPQKVEYISRLMTTIEGKRTKISGQEFSLNPWTSKYPLGLASEIRWRMSLSRCRSQAGGLSVEKQGRVPGMGIDLFWGWQGPHKWYQSSRFGRSLGRRHHGLATHECASPTYLPELEG